MVTIVQNTLMKIEDNDIDAEGQFIFPEEVTGIGEYIFQYKKNLKTIIIPNTVTEIGDSAFDSCRSLTHVTLSDRVTEVGNGVFFYCVSLTSITLPDNVTKIGEYSFFNCISLTHINLPNGLTEIEKGAFSYCISLTHITLPNGAIEIGHCAFDSCSSLTHITVPDTVTKIASMAFKDCTSLSRISIISDDPDKFEAVKALLPASLQGKAVWISKDTAKKIEVKKVEAISRLLNTPLISPLSKCVDLTDDVVIYISQLEGKNHPLAQRLIEKMDALGFPEEGEKGVNEYDVSITKSINAILKAEYNKSNSEPSFSIKDCALIPDGLQKELNTYLIKFKRYSDKCQNFFGSSGGKAENLRRIISAIEKLITLAQGGESGKDISFEQDELSIIERESIQTILRKYDALPIKCHENLKMEALPASSCF